ncbi:MAG TPA: biotin--[acetyl-CoA-carboxylase] ligase [Gemmatimonadaceae bacterium]|nr:biotin--[acetyl-CoA-carboxylase] ligase [Gemmatimonadaceae bacterium]
MSESARYEGRSAAELRAILDLPRVEVYDELPSTQDAAHALGEGGAPAGTLVVADGQSAARGRGRRSWQSGTGAGIWMTLLERPRDPLALGVLSLRMALRMAPVLDRWTSAPVHVKWPNDLLVGGRKLAGLLTEARWRGDRLEWVAIGVGINTRLPEGLDAAALDHGADRVAVLAELLPVMRAAAATPGTLSKAELARFTDRDATAGRRCREPVRGVAAGITADGALIIQNDDGAQTVRIGSLVLEELA